MAERKDGYALRDHWKTLWHKNPKRGIYRGNVHRDAAQLRRIADDIGVDETKRLMEFYFEVNRTPSFMWFLYNYDKLWEEADRRDEDREHRNRLREATRRRMKELQN